MKKIVVLSAFALFFIAPMTFAQKGDTKTEMRKEKKLNHLEEELDLSDDQRKKIEAIDAKYQPKEEANKKEMDKVREERKKIHDAKKAEVKAVLTPEQLEKMEALHKERQAKRQSVRKEVRKEHMKTEPKKVEK